MAKDNEVRTDEFGAILVFLPIAVKRDSMYF